MLQIRQEQYDALAEYARRRYIVQTSALLRRIFPKECAELGDDGVAGRIRTGMTRAKRHRITDNSDVTRYIQLMFTWGDDFDTSPKTPWAASLLALRGASASDRLNNVCRASAQQLEARLAEEVSRT
jgi:hypothetical protein